MKNVAGVDDPGYSLYSGFSFDASIYQCFSASRMSRG
jgi:hypothetical protein